jgi:putative ABC transport system permease protein
MLKNHIRIAWRTLLNNKVYSVINILGLTIGLTACLLVASVVIEDLSYDRQWAKSDQIYRLVTISNANKNMSEKSSDYLSGFAPSLKQKFPEVEEFVRMNVRSDRIKLGSDKDGVVLRTLSAEPSIWNVLNFNVISGNPTKYVDGYKNIVITEKIKNEYFPNTDPVGKIVSNIPAFGEPEKMIITGVIKNIPSNTHLRSDILSINKLRPVDDVFNGNGGNFAQQYIVLKSGTSLALFTDKINKWFQEEFKGTYNPKQRFEFQSIKDVYLRSDFEERSTQGSIRNVYIFSGVALLLLLIACINFVNLTTARALKRVREVGIRKVLGAGKGALIFQFLFESLIFFTISFFLALLLYVLYSSSLETYIGHPLALTFANNVTLFASTCGLILIVSILTGLYPAWMIARPAPITVLKGKLSAGTESPWLRKSLVIGQFVISIAILLATIVVQSQLRFISKKDLGFNKSNIIALNNFATWGTQGPAFKQELLRLSGVEGATITEWYPSNGPANMTSTVIDPQNKDSHITVNYIEADIDFSKLMKLKLLSGSLLSSKLPSDFAVPDSLKKDYRYRPVLVTEHTAKVFGVKELGKRVDGVEGIPVGIIKDFNNESLKSAVSPVIVKASTDSQYGYMLIKTAPQNRQQVLANVQKLYHKFYPEKIFEFAWLDDLLDAQYRSEQKMQQLFVFFSFLIIFLACLGLFGLVTFAAEQRIKEIGIRKVLGAEVLSIVKLLSTDFMKLVLLAFVIASPIAFYAMSKWLQDFAFRIEIEWWMFAVAGLSAALIAFLTISFQAVKAAIANPVKSLRAE